MCICNFCSGDIAITNCINCGANSCGKTIYCCQNIQTGINDISSMITSIDRRLDSVTENEGSYKEINTLRENLNLINESTKNLLKNPLMTF